MKYENLSGFLNVAKPEGLTSHDVVACLRRRLDGASAGHAGTLDPLATGVLLICIGKATKIVRFLLGERKEYRAVIRLGVRTNTHDREGEILSECRIDGLKIQEVKEASRKFVGVIQQIPPMFSAVKFQGRRLYQLARKGVQVQRSPRSVTIFDLSILDFRPPLLTLSVECSAGTYIRALAADLGDELGCGAHLTALERTRIGPFALAESKTIDQIEESALGGRLHRLLISMNRALQMYPEVVVDQEKRSKVRRGIPLLRSDLIELSQKITSGNVVRVVDDSGELLAMGEMTVAPNPLKYLRVLTS